MVSIRLWVWKLYVHLAPAPVLSCVLCVERGMGGAVGTEVEARNLRCVSL